MFFLLKLFYDFVKKKKIWEEQTRPCKKNENQAGQDKFIGDDPPFTVCMLIFLGMFSTRDRKVGHSERFLTGGWY